MIFGMGICVCICTSGSAEGDTWAWIGEMGIKPRSAMYETSSLPSIICLQFWSTWHVNLSNQCSLGITNWMSFILFWLPDLSMKKRRPEKNLADVTNAVLNPACCPKPGPLSCVLLDPLSMLRIGGNSVKIHVWKLPTWVGIHWRYLIDLRTNGNCGCHLVQCLRGWAIAIQENDGL